MSNPNQQDPQGPWPVYGQGSGSQPAGAGGAGGAAGQGAQGSGGGYGSGGGQGSGGAHGAWPVYGQPGSSYPSSGQPPTGVHPQGGPARPSQYPQSGPAGPGPYPQAPGSEPPASGPFQTPQYGTGGAGAYPTQGAYPTSGAPSSPMGSYPQQPPSRTAPILLIVLGAVMMLVIAPVVMFAVLLSGVGLSQIVNQSLETTNGGTVTVDASGTLGVITTSNDFVTCTLENQSGSTQMVPEVDGAILVARNLTPGEYVLNCEGLTAADTIVILDGGALDSMFPATMTAMGWATAVGVLGLGVLIGGIVWLVKRNKARKAIMPKYPPYGGPGALGGPGPWSG